MCFLDSMPFGVMRSRTLGCSYHNGRLVSAVEGGLEMDCGLSLNLPNLPDFSTYLMIYIFDDLNEYTPECTNFSKKDCWHRNNRPIDL